jgi:hypothetical protein
MATSEAASGRALLAAGILFAAVVVLAAVGSSPVFEAGEGDARAPR